MTKESDKELHTDAQRRAMHLYFEELAEELNDAGLDMRKVLQPEVDIPWTKQTVKDYLWRPVQKEMTGKQSTTELTKDEVTKIYDTVNRFLGEKHGIHKPFPSIERFHQEIQNED